MCERVLLSDGGILAQIPYGVPEHGIILSSASSLVQVALLPVSALEDPRFGPVLTRNGIYRIEDASGHIARMGQGRILDRVRSHRAAPIILPARILAAVPANGEWSSGQRTFLEASWAAYCRLQGDALASNVFVRHFPSLDAPQRKVLEAVLSDTLALLAAGGVLLAGDPHDLFLPLEYQISNQGGPTPLEKTAGQPSAYFRRFETGTCLRYDDGRIVATALARDVDVVLDPESLVYTTLASTVGAAFGQSHRDFLQLAAVVPIGPDLGRTTRPVAQPTAAALIKRATGGRTHSSSRWQTRYPRGQWRRPA